MRQTELDERAMLELDFLVEDTVDEMEADYARSGGRIPRDPNRGRSGMRQQVGMWNQIIRRLGQWGVATGQSRWGARQIRPSTLRTEQPQVIGQRRWRGRPQRGITGANQPDIQAEDPRSGRRINVEVDSTRNEIELLNKLQRIAQNDPQARVAAVVTDPTTGAALRTHVYDPLTGRTTQHAGGLQRRDVLDLDE
jgi:hypothetical protein